MKGVYWNVGDVIGDAHYGSMWTAKHVLDDPFIHETRLDNHPEARRILEHCKKVESIHVITVDGAQHILRQILADKGVTKQITNKHIVLVEWIDTNEFIAMWHYDGAHLCSARVSLHPKK